MSVHDETHEALLERWVAAEELSPAEERRLQDCAECAAKKNEFEALSGELDELGARERAADIEASQASTPPAWEDRALVSLRDAMSAGPKEDTGGSARGRRLLAFLVVAAAAVVLLFVLRPEPIDGPHAERVWLGQQDIPDMAPAGSVERIERFTWTYDTPELGTYRIRLYHPGEDRPFSTATTQAPRWEPDAPESLPAHFIWEVEAFDALGELVASGREEVRLR